VTVTCLLLCRWLQIEQHKLEHIDSSWSDALAAAKEACATDVVYKLEALIGVVLPQAGGNSSSSGSGAVSAPVPAAAAAAANAARGAAGVGMVASITQNFRPDLALKQELHDIKLKKRARLANLTLPVPSPADAAKAAAAGVVPSSSVSFSTGAYGTRQFGLPDPTCGGVPQGYVAVRWVVSVQLGLPRCRQPAQVCSSACPEATASGTAPILCVSREL
jgi:hypothetical protein